MASKKSQELYEKLKSKHSYKYLEEFHCPLVIEIFSDPDKGTVSHFCQEAVICDDAFYIWVQKYPVFQSCYKFARMVARVNWEKWGAQLESKNVIGTEFERWRLVGWSRFGVGRTSRVKLRLNKNESPNEHYKQLLAQAEDGEFTAAEIKQLMEAINVGLNAHQIFELQKQLDALRADLDTMETNKGKNDKVDTVSNKRATKKD